MEVTFDQLMQLFWWGTITISVMCALLLVAVALASFVVFRTRRDGPEQIFQPRAQPGEAGQVGDPYEDPEAERRFNWLAENKVADDKDENIPMGEDVMKSVADGAGHKRFMEQWAGGKGK